MRRPLVPLVIAFLAGIVAVRLLQPPALVWFPTGLVAVGLALLSAAYHRLHIAGVFLLFLFFSLGAGRLGVEPYLLPRITSIVYPKRSWSSRSCSRGL